MLKVTAMCHDGTEVSGNLTHVYVGSEGCRRYQFDNGFTSDWYDFPENMIVRIVRED